jgi:hypothetical protein
MVDTPHADAAVRSPFVPCTLLALAFVVWLAFQAWALVGERSQLALARAAQEAPTEKAKKMRAALDTLALTTQRLAGEGSAAARAVVDELAKRGVTIYPAGAASAAAPASAASK